MAGPPTREAGHLTIEEPLSTRRQAVTAEAGVSPFRLENARTSHTWKSPRQASIIRESCNSRHPLALRWVHMQTRPERNCCFAWQMCVHSSACSALAATTWGRRQADRGTRPPTEPPTRPLDLPFHPHAPSRPQSASHTFSRLQASAALVGHHGPYLVPLESHRLTSTQHKSYHWKALDEIYSTMGTPARELLVAWSWR